MSEAWPWLLVVCTLGVVYCGYKLAHIARILLLIGAELRVHTRFWEDQQERAILSGP